MLKTVIGRRESISRPGRIHPLRSLALLALAAGLALTAMGGTNAAAQTVSIAAGTGPVRQVSIALFKSRTLEVDRPFSTALIGAPEIADILPMSDKTLYVQAKKIGTTNISMFNADMQVVAVVDIEVTPDTGNQIGRAHV